MNNFNAAIIPLLKNEGGYSNDPSDSGGETYRGISRKNFPEWVGWSIVDNYKPLHDEQIINDEHLEALVHVFYYTTFWLSNELNYINSSIITTKVLDMCVNMGSYRGIELLQQALDLCGISVNEDGKMGPVTYKAVNSLDENKLHEALKAVCVKFYEDLVQEHPHDAKFLNGWLVRAKQ